MPCPLDEAYSISSLEGKIKKKDEDSVPLDDYEYLSDDMSEEEVISSPKQNLYNSLETKKFTIDTENSISGTNSLRGIPSSSYKLLEQSPCKDYFFHIDTCKSCQRRLAYRIKNYIEKRKVDVQPGSNGVSIDFDSLLFSDRPEKPIKKYKRKMSYADKDTIENFENPLPKCIQNRPVYILLFGLLVILLLDKISSI